MSKRREMPAQPVRIELFVRVVVEPTPTLVRRCARCGGYIDVGGCSCGEPVEWAWVEACS